MTRKIRRLLPIFGLFSLFIFASCTPDDATVTVDEANVEVVQSIEESDAEAAEETQTEAPTELPADEAAPEPAGSLAERVEVTAAGFSVQPPAGYSVNSEDPEGVQMMADGATEDSGPMIGIFGGVFGEEMTADQMYDFMVAADETLGVVERLPFEGQNGDGFIAEFTNTEGETTIKGRLMLTLIDGQGTLITAMATPDMWDAGFGQLLDEVAQSIEYFPPAE